MEFKDKLNNYIKKLNLTSKELSTKSNISESVISRYRNGERKPKTESEQLKKIIKTLEELNKEKNYLIKENISKELTKTLTETQFNHKTFSNNLNILLEGLNININNMSKYINFDSSHISRIRYNKAKPSDPISFGTKIVNYIIDKKNTKEDKEIIKNIIKCQDKTLEDKEETKKLLLSYLINNQETNDKQIEKFLINFDNFNLNDYIKVIKFDQLKIPNIPFYKGKTKNYYGLEQMKQGELDFFKTTVLSKSKEDIFMYSNMPMEDMAKDKEFGKKWMFAIACCLKKGLHLNIIHNLDRPYNEMMLGLESWIPIYMTGQISPYYFKNQKSTIYNNIDYTSGTIALSGECIKGNHNKGKYYLTVNKEELKYYKEKTNLLLKKASPLMEIYKKENEQEFKKLLIKDKNIKTKRTRIYSSLPLFTIDNNLLKEILIKNNLQEQEIKKIMNYKKEEEKNIKDILKENKINDTIYKIENKNEKITLALENIFYDNITYTYDQYLKHYNQTIKYQEKNKNYKITKANDKTFNNITITILEDNYVILSKSKNPTIHFCIKHPKLIEAIKNFTPLVTEKE